MTRILIVDDLEENLYYLKVLLEGNGYAVDVAHGGEEALERARAIPPALVISDLLMPGMDGYTLLRHWKADARLKGVPFLVFTATYTEEEDESLALNLGADAYIVKPCEPDELLARIRQVQDEGGASPAAPPRAPIGTDDELLRAYNHVLIRKLEKKTLQLEESNRSLKRDIAERRRAEERLEQSTALLRIAGRAARLGGWFVDLKENTITWSDETCAIHGVPAGHTPTQDEALQYYAPEDRADVVRRLEACANEGTPFDYEIEIVTSDGRKCWIRSIGEPARDADGTIIAIQGALQDISDRKHLEQKILRAQRMESIATLTGGMAHDLNNVLAPIVLSIPLLKDEIADEDSLEILATIESCAQRGTEMVRQVLSFARGTEGARVRVELAAILKDLERVVRDTFPRSVELRTEIPDDLRGIVGDPTQLHQVFLNLFVNARDAMPDGGALTVSAENVDVDEHYAAMSGDAKPGPHVRVSVVDSGAGMAPEVLSRIFEPFFTTKAEGRGTGLGLPTMTAIVNNHGGFVNVYSEVGEGTAFRIHFPARHVDGKASPASPAPEVWVGSGELILVVDDEAAVRSISRQTLEAFGYRVLTAVDGQDAMDVYELRGKDIALVLTDFIMPNMDGPGLILALRRMDPAVRIIAASGGGGDGGRARAASAGARHFLPKPYTADTLLATIHRALRDETDGAKA